MPKYNYLTVNYISDSMKKLNLTGKDILYFVIVLVQIGVFVGMLKVSVNDLKTKVAVIDTELKTVRVEINRIDNQGKQGESLLKYQEVRIVKLEEVIPQILPQLAEIKADIRWIRESISKKEQNIAGIEK